jgi:hypothetical protein
VAGKFDVSVDNGGLVLDPSRSAPPSVHTRLGNVRLAAGAIRVHRDEQGVTVRLEDAAFDGRSWFDPNARHAPRERIEVDLSLRVPAL